MSLAVCASLLLAFRFGHVAALPGDPELTEQIRRSHAGEQFPCIAKECHKPDKKFSNLLNTQPGIQWMDHGGYCGSWSIQRAAMAKGAWISQAQVRNHTIPGGGHDNEILATNIDVALKNLKLKSEGFDYKNLPTPQADAYRKWIKEKLVAGHAIVWMIMLKGGQYPVYPHLPYGFYSHVEPVVGILSDHPLNDTQWYDDDYIVHYTDADTETYYRSMASLPDDTTFSGNCAHPHYIGFPCIYEKYGFGWSIEGFLDDRKGLPLSLTIRPFRSEPDLREGRKPESLKGTVTVEGLTAGNKYAIYRWNSTDSAFDYSRPHSIHRFIAEKAVEVYTDPEVFSSAGTTYYRCVEDASDSIVI
eukprot:gnl/TRDRNA2_/TRDRNA2_34094_c0_seq1.p1 gnl/TRDRNA2_/TRDRNA2_34094_c0~~gnl/TRDRNA2_/TRDRNA2_34094_c0_seq1.p1  ORF type:complete len:359 (+),score=13.58 gnl/TRDRNA2_/TRDRNA2_34094_c0_seq1:87-1163(+)